MLACQEKVRFSSEIISDRRRLTYPPHTPEKFGAAEDNFLLQNSPTPFTLMHNNNRDEPNGLHEEKQEGKWGLFMNETLHSLIKCNFKETRLPTSFYVQTYTQSV